MNLAVGLTIGIAKPTQIIESVDLITAIKSLSSYECPQFVIPVSTQYEIQKPVPHVAVILS